VICGIRFFDRTPLRRARWIKREAGGTVLTDTRRGPSWNCITIPISVEKAGSPYWPPLAWRRGFWYRS
jgi:hypothetical protein